MAQLKLPFDTIDDLIYDARVGDLDSLKQNIDALSTQHSCQPTTVLEAAIDIDDDGEGSGSCLLHWPSANGNSETLNYLLSLVPSKSAFISHPNRQGNTPLHWAALNLHLDCVTALVNAGADVNAKNVVGQWVGFEAERVYEEESALDDDDDDAAAADDRNENGKTTPPTEETEKEKEEPKETEKQKKAREVVELLLGSEGFKEGGDGEADIAATTTVESAEAKGDVEMSG